MKLKLEFLNEIAEKYDISLTHFLVKTTQRNDSTEGIGRFADQYIPADTDVAIIGGLIVNELDGMLSMPIGPQIYLHQVSMLHRATMNHSCSPNCRIVGFNKLVSLSNIYNSNELTIDYGTVSVGAGNIIFDCDCGSENCRGQIKTDDYMQLPIEMLAAYPRYMREQDNEFLLSRLMKVIPITMNIPGEQNK